MAPEYQRQAMLARLGIEIVPALEAGLDEPGFENELEIPSMSGPPIMTRPVYISYPHSASPETNRNDNRSRAASAPAVLPRARSSGSAQANAALGAALMCSSSLVRRLTTVFLVFFLNRSADQK